MSLGDFMTALSRIKEKLSLLTNDPICDIEETKTHTFLSFDLPNLKLEQLNLSVSGKTLFISALRPHPTAIGKEETKVLQCHHHNFFREFSFPVFLSSDSIHAYYQSGVLRVAVPKANIVNRQQVTVHGSPVGIFLGSVNPPNPKRKEPIESYSDIDDYDWE